MLNLCTPVSLVSEKTWAERRRKGAKWAWTRVSMASVFCQASDDLFSRDSPNSLLAQMLSTELINYRGPSSASSNFANIFVTQDGVSQRLFNHLAAHSKSLTLPSSYEHHIQASGPHHICSQGDGDAQSATRIKSPSPGHLLGVN
jgi:hypothetical protein